MKNLLVILVAILSMNSIVYTQQTCIHVFMAGDSTMANKPLYKSVYDTIMSDSIPFPFLEKGWGQLLPQFFNEKVIIKNYAQNGRSTRTFIEQGWWDSIITQVKSDDYVIIQFGHNDSAVDRPDRYTCPADYVKNLTRFVEETRSKGAKPIICTSVARRKFDKQGNFKDSHGEYIQLARQVAKKENVPLIDMYEKSKTVLIQIGDKASEKLFMLVDKGGSPLYPQGYIDDTHFRKTGALLMDTLFITGLKEQNIEPLVNELKDTHHEKH